MILGLTVGFIFCTYVAWLHYRWQRPWAQIEREDSESRVIALLGQPSAVTVEDVLMKETWQHGNVFSTAGRHIVKTLRFNAPPPLPSYSVSLDSDGRVVAKGEPPTP